MKNNNNHITGEMLCHLRMVKGLPQKLMAKSLGISQQAYSRMEKRKKVYDKKVEQVLKAMQATFEELMEVQKFCPPQV
jgi:transcriptional regulator with XRE-family HTH domain